jgi:hypothetical protein
VSNYYLGETIGDEEVAAVQAAAEKLGIAIENTRLDSLCISGSPLITGIFKECGRNPKDTIPS